MNRALLILVLSLMACKDTTTLVVRVSVPDADGSAVPASGLVLAALPYDRDSVIAALEAAAPSPRPSTAVLDSAFAEFRAPFAAFASASYALEALKDSLRLAADNPAERTRIEAAQAVQRAEIERLRPALAAARLRLAARTDSARAALRAWEDTAYAGYDTLTKPLARFRDPVGDTTDVMGIGIFEVKAGDWWITARAWDAADPNSSWYWNVRAEGDTVVLSPANARRKARY